MEGVRLRESQKYIVREGARGADGEIDRERGKGRGIDGVTVGQIKVYILRCSYSFYHFTSCQIH